MKLEIPKPCAENWDKMNSNSKGKFCLNCQKNVIDFSNKSDAEVLNFFTQNQAKVCGRFRSDQLNRSIQY